MLWLTIFVFMVVNEFDSEEKWAIRAIKKLAVVFLALFMAQKAPAEFFILALMTFCGVMGLFLYRLEEKRKKRNAPRSSV